MPGNEEQSVRNAVTSVLLWDGSTAGYLKPSAAVSQSEFLDINTSLRSATVFARRADDSDVDHQCLLDFKEEVERSGSMPEYLYGAPLVVTSAPSDLSIAGRLKDLKPGMWVRFRNLHIDKAAIQRTFPTLPILSSTASVSINTAEFVLNPSLNNSLDDLLSSMKVYSWIIGTVHSDTHISLLLPFFK